MIIKIEKLHIRDNLGIYEFEKFDVRDIFVDIEINFDDRKVIKSRNIRDTINYEEIVDLIKNYLSKNKLELLENIAYDILEEIRSNYKDKILHASITISKPNAVDFVNNIAITSSF